jgi:hypothetical protein
MDKDSFQQFLAEIDSSLGDFDRGLTIWACEEVDLATVDLSDKESLMLLAGVMDPEFPKLRSDLNSFLKRIFTVYLELGKEQRASLAGVFEKRQYVLGYLLTFPEIAAENIHSESDELWVKIGAVSAMIEGGRIDFRDLWVSLGTLYCTAKNHGMDSARIFLEVEELGSPDLDFYESSNFGRGILSDFLKSEYLASMNCA